MSYIGLQPQAGSYNKLDNLAPLFDGSTTTFTLQVGGFPVVAGTAQNLLISIDGVLQEPGTAYQVNADQITFTTAPVSGQKFFGIRLGHVLNVGVPSEEETYVRTTNNQIIAGNKTFTDVVTVPNGTAAAPGLRFTTEANTGLFRAGTNSVGITTAGVERVRVTNVGRVGIGTSAPTNLLDVNANSIRVRTARTPESATATGNTGEICWDSNFIYVCIATNTWRRVAIAAW